MDSISWICNPQGHFSGGNRRVLISNGSEAIICPMPETKKNKVTIHRKDEASSFTFERDDILEVTITWHADTMAHCAMTYFDAPPAPAVIRGTALNLTSEGELPDGTARDNKYNKSWRFNCPAVRIRATEYQPYDMMLIALIAIGAIGFILLLKLMLGSKKA